MADDIDKTNEIEDMVLQRRVHQLRTQAGKRELPAIGRCHFCEEPLPRGERFCDTDCRDDHAKLSRMRA